MQCMGPKLFPFNLGDVTVICHWQQKVTIPLPFCLFGIVGLFVNKKFYSKATFTRKLHQRNHYMLLKSFDSHQPTFLIRFAGFILSQFLTSCSVRV